MSIEFIFWKYFFCICNLRYLPYASGDLSHMDFDCVLHFVLKDKLKCFSICNLYFDYQSSKNQIKSSLYSPHYAEACNELRGPSPRLSAWATQLRRNVATVASRWGLCVDLTGPGIEPQTSRTVSVRFATELTAGYYQS